MDALDIGDIFFKDRFPSEPWKIFTIVLYAIFGLALATARMFILILTYFAVKLLPEMTLIKRFILRVVGLILGIVIEEENCSEFDKSCRVIMSNHVTLFDYFPLHVTTGCTAPSYTGPGLPATWGLKDFGTKQKGDALKAKIQKFLVEVNSLLLLHPEEETTSGEIALLKFSPWYGFAASRIQPVCLKVRRPSITDIKPNMIESTAAYDLFWALFVPYTVFKIKYLPVITRLVDESDEGLIGRVETAIGNELGLKTTNLTASDKGEFQKRFIAERYKPVLITEAPNSAPDAYELKLRKIRIEKMSIQVKEVLPHVPMSVIMQDIRKTRNVDVTISNILEGQIQFTPLPSTQEALTRPPPPPIREPIPSTSRSQLMMQSPETSAPNPPKEVSFSRNAQERMMSLSERKKRMIEQARKRYIERHGLGL